MKKIIECVPNFSEGVDLAIINQITDQIKSVEGVSLLDVDPGKATNRTVVTLVGEPEAVIEAAFLGIKKAAELIDMSKHQGEHPRMGATDVCPLIPVSNITMEETAAYAQKLAKRVGEELQIPVYLYEMAQANKNRSNLSVIRSGEYEGIAEKIIKPEWKPDFGPAKFNAKTGNTAIGARDFLIAYNINLNTTSTRIANRIAFDVREAGRVVREGNPFAGKVKQDGKGEDVRIPGTLKHVKAIGWYIEEYKVAQISMNLTNYKATPIHVAFDEVCERARDRGTRVTGSELVGLLPLKAMIDAGNYFLDKQGVSKGLSEEDLIHIAIKSMGLDELAPFDPQKKIIEYAMASPSEKRLVNMKVNEFVDTTASEQPAPGGGSVAALCGALGAALGAMDGNLSANKRGWENKTAFFSDLATQAQALKKDLLGLVDEDTAAFNKIMEAFGLPKESEQEKKARTEAIESASQYATETPFRTMQKAYACVPMLKEMVEKGNPNCLSDAAVGLLCVKTAVRGAYFNVQINAGGLKDRAFADKMVKDAKALLAKNHQECDVILEKVEASFG
jgi:glutamate formiminotransferase/formiminotetrahydrofolate cyclodeaminase